MLESAKKRHQGRLLPRLAEGGWEGADKSRTQPAIAAGNRRRLSASPSLSLLDLQGFLPESHLSPLRYF